MPERLEGRTALVTGATSGIGLATAHALAGAGARVLVLGRRREVLGRLAVELGGGALPVACDLTEPSAVARAIEQVVGVTGGAPHILVNDAGSFELAPVEDTTDAMLTSALEVNFAAPFRLARAFLPAMRARGDGIIVTIGSIADRQVFPGNAAYAASKHALRALHEVMRAELRGSGVRTSLVSPGPVDTPLWDALDPDGRDGFTPRAAMLAAATVADAVLWCVTRPAMVNIDELRLGRA